MPSSKKEIQPFYKNWFFWILVIVAVGYFATRDNKPKAPTVDYLTQLKEKAFAKLDSGIVSDKLLNNKTSDDDRDELFSRIPLEKLQPGSILHFGSSTSTSDQITITILTPTSAEVIVSHMTPVKGDSSNMQPTVETGTYEIGIFEGAQILTDNQDYPLQAKPALILTNLNYGTDKGFSNLSKKFCIAKSKHISGTESVEIRIYPWLDPVNYPKNGQEFHYLASHELFGLSVKK